LNEISQQFISDVLKNRRIGDLFETLAGAFVVGALLAALTGLAYWRITDRVPYISLAWFPFTAFWTVDFKSAPQETPWKNEGTNIKRMVVHISENLVDQPHARKPSACAEDANLNAQKHQNAAMETKA
jgi:hypothetical protein